jgi:transcriptional regulator with XRE-family HTH domain
MKIYEKIKLILEQKGWNLSEFHRYIKELFEDEAITYLTLYRTINGLTHLRESTLFQIACSLGTTPEELKKDTEEQEKFSRYVYNKKAYLEVINSQLDFLTAKLVLLPGAKTQTEQDPIEKGNFIKWLYGLQGETTCIVVTESGVQRHTINKNESLSFKSTNPHYFENNTTRKAVCLLIQHPKYI